MFWASKMFLQFWETRLGRPPTFNPKIRRKKMVFSRPHRASGNRPCAQTLLFLQKARPMLFKMSGGSAYLGHHGRELCRKKEKVIKLAQNPACKKLKWSHSLLSKQGPCVVSRIPKVEKRGEASNKTFLKKERSMRMDTGPLPTNQARP